MQAQTCNTRGGSTHQNKTQRGNAEQKPITMNAETGRYTRENWNSGRNKGEKHMPLCKMWQELINVGEEYASLSALGQHNCTAGSV